MPVDDWGGRFLAAGKSGGEVILSGRNGWPVLQAWGAKQPHLNLNAVGVLQLLLGQFGWVCLSYAANAMT